MNFVCVTELIILYNFYYFFISSIVVEIRTFFEIWLFRLRPFFFTLTKVQYEI